MENQLARVKDEIYENLEHIIHGHHLIIWRPSALAITWYHESHGPHSHFHYTEALSNILGFHTLFLIGAAVLSFASLPFHRSHMVFTAYCLLLSIAMILRVFIVASLLEPSSRLYTTAVSSAITELEEHYEVLSDSSYVSTINAYMINANCCGVHGPHDFRHVDLSINKQDFLYPFEPNRGADVYFPPGNVSYKFKFPPACCRHYLFNEGSKEHSFKAVVRCAQGTDITLIKQYGCLDRLEDLVKDQKVFMTAVLAIMFSTESVSIAMAIYLALIETKRYKDDVGTHF